MGGCSCIQQAQKSVCGIFPPHFQFSPLYLLSLNLKPRFRTYYTTFYFLILCSEISNSRANKLLEHEEVSITQQKSIEDLPHVVGFTRGDIEMGSEISVPEEQAYVLFLSPSNMFHFIELQLLVLDSLHLLKLVSWEPVLFHISLIM